jgi:hypothetical protein
MPEFFIIFVSGLLDVVVSRDNRSETNNCNIITDNMTLFVVYELTVY